MDERRCYVVPSAPGRRFPDDEKVTDLLYRSYRLKSEGQDFMQAFSLIRQRFLEIAGELNVQVDIGAHLDMIEREIDQGASEDFCASRGEYLNGLLLADYLGYCFLDPKDFIFFASDGSFDSERTNSTLAGAARTDRKGGHSRILRPGCGWWHPNLFTRGQRCDGRDRRARGLCRYV